VAGQLSFFNTPAAVMPVNLQTPETAYQQMFLSIKDHWKTLTNPSNGLLAGGLLVLLFYFSILPGINADSVDYHYQVYFNGMKKFKVSPAWPTYTAATASTRQPYPRPLIPSPAPPGKPFYPLNGVLIGLFLFGYWPDPPPPAFADRPGPILVVHDPLPAHAGNISSPLPIHWSHLPVLCPDPPIRAPVRQEIHLSGILLPSLILLYAPVAKLSAFPVLLVSLYIFFSSRHREEGPSIAQMAAHRLADLSSLVGPNIILSGYLVYPLFAWTFFTPTGKCPGIYYGGLFSNKLLAERGILRGYRILRMATCTRFFRECSSPG